MQRRSSILFIVLQDKDLFCFLLPSSLLFNVNIGESCYRGFMLLLS